MKNPISGNLITGIFFTLLIFLATSFAACSEEKNEGERPSNPDIVRLGESLSKLKDLKENSQYGKLKGMYPEESKEILENAMAEIGRFILSINDGTDPNPSQDKIAQAITKSEASITDFKATVRTEDVEDPLLPAELYVNGESDGYIDFGVSSDYSRFGADGKQAFTVELWMKVAKTSGFGCIVSTYLEDSSDPRYRKGWMINHFNNDYMRMSYGLNTYGLWEPGDGYRDTGVWKHFAAVYDDNGIDGDKENGKPIVIKLYFDGNLVRTVSNGNAGSEFYDAADDKNSAMTAFLQIDKNGNKNRKIAGYIKDFHLWKTAKSQDEIKKLMNKETKVIGTESDLVCGWTFDMTVKNDKDMKDLTGRHTAAVKGNYEWQILEEE